MKGDDMICYDKLNDVEAVAFQTVRPSWFDFDRYLPANREITPSTSRVLLGKPMPLTFMYQPLKKVSFGDFFVPS